MIAVASRYYLLLKLAMPHSHTCQSPRDNKKVPGLDHAASSLVQQMPTAFYYHDNEPRGSDQARMVGSDTTATTLPRAALPRAGLFSGLSRSVLTVAAATWMTADICPDFDVAVDINITCLHFVASAGTWTPSN